MLWVPEDTKAAQKRLRILNAHRNDNSNWSIHWTQSRAERAGGRPRQACIFRHTHMDNVAARCAAMPCIYFRHSPLPHWHGFKPFFCYKRNFSRLHWIKSISDKPAISKNVLTIPLGQAKLQIFFQLSKAESLPGTFTVCSTGRKAWIINPLQPKYLEWNLA